MFLSICYFLESETSKRPIFGDLFWKPDHCVFATLPKTRSDAHFFHPRENSPTFVPSVFDEMGTKTETSFVEILKRSIFCRFQRFVSEPFCFERKFKKTMLKLFFRLFFAQPESKLVISASSWSSWTPLSYKKPELNQNQTFLSPNGHSFESNDI